MKIQGFIKKIIKNIYHEKLNFSKIKFSKIKQENNQNGKFDRLASARQER